MTEPKPCKVCGSKPKISDIIYARPEHIVWCCGEISFGDTEDQAIAAWNAAQEDKG